jgi:anti-anti-sigma factor
MSVASVVADNETLLVLSGEVDIANVDKLVRALDAVDNDPPLAVVVDLGAVRFLGVCGVGALIDGARRLEAAGSVLRLVGASPITRRVVDILGASDLLALAPGHAEGQPGRFYRPEP